MTKNPGLGIFQAKIGGILTTLYPSKFENNQHENRQITKTQKFPSSNVFLKIFKISKNYKKSIQNNFFTETRKFPSLDRGVFFRTIP